MTQLFCGMFHCVKYVSFLVLLSKRAVDVQNSLRDERTAICCFSLFTTQHQIVGRINATKYKLCCSPPHFM